MVVGEESPDDGTVSVPKKLTIGYFRQDVEEMQGRSVLDEAIAGSEENRGQIRSPVYRGVSTLLCKRPGFVFGMGARGKGQHPFPRPAM
jgi:hypothetical protein